MSGGRTGGFDSHGADDSWKLLGACRDVPNPEIFYPERGDAAVATEAKRVCRGCLVVRDCFEAGMHEPFGIWGGLSAKQRVAVRTRVARKKESAA